jgi:predicted GNAT family N-acyltransferase
VERVSVVRDSRKNGLAQNILVELEKQACLSYDKLSAFYLSGDEKAENLYKRVGYLTIPNSLHIRSNIRHIKMIKPMDDYWKVKDNWIQLL